MVSVAKIVGAGFGHQGRVDCLEALREVHGWSHTGIEGVLSLTYLTVVVELPKLMVAFVHMLLVVYVVLAGVVAYEVWLIVDGYVVVVGGNGGSLLALRLQAALRTGLPKVCSGLGMESAAEACRFAG